MGNPERRPRGTRSAWRPAAPHRPRGRLPSPTFAHGQRRPTPPGRRRPGRSTRPAWPSLLMRARTTGLAMRRMLYPAYTHPPGAVNHPGPHARIPGKRQGGCRSDCLFQLIRAFVGLDVRGGKCPCPRRFGPWNSCPKLVNRHWGNVSYNRISLDQYSTHERQSAVIGCDWDHSESCPQGARVTVEHSRWSPCRPEGG
jgi:hypothetical protein